MNGLRYKSGALLLVIAISHMYVVFMNELIRKTDYSPLDTLGEKPVPYNTILYNTCLGAGIVVNDLAPIGPLHWTYTLDLYIGPIHWTYTLDLYIGPIHWTYTLDLSVA